MPEKEYWDEILSSNQNKKVCRQIKTILDLESKGATIGCYKADVSNQDEIALLINHLRSQFGSINGVIHAAGVAGRGYLMNKDIEQFHKVLSPKILGTTFLYDIVKKDKLDFLSCSHLSQL